ncbi:hypothetical protein CY34DRAFT_813796, partial [Suillus luteus UH-Slu-Lm8-n1]
MSQWYLSHQLSWGPSNITICLAQPEAIHGPASRTAGLSISFERKVHRLRGYNFAQLARSERSLPQN